MTIAHHRSLFTKGVLQLLTMVAPYLGDDELSFYRECEDTYIEMLAGDN